MNPRMKLPIGTLLAVALLVWLALSDWGEEQAEAGPLAWKQEFQQSLLAPLREQTLTLSEVDRVLGTGQLWMISADDQPGLVSRYSLQSDGQHWQVQAAIELDQPQTESLVRAQAWSAGMPDQAVSPAIGEALAHYPVARLSLVPEQPLELQRITATLGNADWQMPVEAGEAWIYGREGAVVSVSNDQAYSIMFGLRRE